MQGERHTERERDRERNVLVGCGRDERDREIQGERQTQRETQRDTWRDRERQRQRQRERNRERQREREMQRATGQMELERHGYSSEVFNGNVGRKEKNYKIRIA